MHAPKPHSHSMSAGNCYLYGVEAGAGLTGIYGLRRGVVSPPGINLSSAPFPLPPLPLHSLYLSLFFTPPQPLSYPPSIPAPPLPSIHPNSSLHLFLPLSHPTFPPPPAGLTRPLERREGPSQKMHNSLDERGRGGGGEGGGGSGGGGGGGRPLLGLMRHRGK